MADEELAAGGNSDDETSDYDDVREEPFHSQGFQSRTKRRAGVSAESVKGSIDNKWSPPVYSKSAEERSQLADIIRTSRDGKLHMLFGVVSKHILEQIIDAMQTMLFEAGQHVIEQGAIGDYFYIVRSGIFDIYVKRGEALAKKVFEASVGFAFGELALLYNAPRSATVTAQCQAEVWALDRTAFRNLVVRSSEAQFKQRVEFLRGIDIFHVLSETEIASLAEVLEEEEFEDDEAIIEQGERDDNMFIVSSGQAVACIRGEQGEVEVMKYGVGSFFGEVALLNGCPRQASVYAVGPCTCAYVSRATVMRVLGSMASLLERNLGKYEKYQDAIAKATSGEQEAQSVGWERTRRKRERGVDHLLDSMMVKTSSARREADDEEPRSLADKVAQDFNKDALVLPCSELEVPDSTLMLFGGLVLGQSFTMDKICHARTSIAPICKDEDLVYSWTASTKLKHGTDISVVCQKGQKSACDPTPNQDNFFVHHRGNVTMYGVCDGHGPFGHLVSFRLVQSLPFYLVNSPHYGRDWRMALKDAFNASGAELREFCWRNSINIEASGAAGSVVVMEEQTLHVAHIGDARVMIGSWSKHDSRMIFCTQDHKPELPEERQRLESCGSEVRDMGDGSHRIYLPGSNFPGLTMSRAFGDTACGGVVQDPEYHTFVMQPTDQWYSIIASDGIWEFLEGEQVCQLTSKKLRLKGPRETSNFLVSASRKRWAHCCGDYCDDISAVIVQWNSDNKESSTNHSLTIKRNS